MNEQSYNGWTNYETWLVNLWLTNDQGTYGYVLGMDADGIEGYVFDLVNQDRDPHGLVMDLVGAALAEVDWNEISDSLREDAA